MKKTACLIAVAFFFAACGSNDLDKETALKLLSDMYSLIISTKLGLGLLEGAKASGMNALALPACLLDHVILSTEGFYSFADEGMI